MDEIEREALDAEAAVKALPQAAQDPAVAALLRRASDLRKRADELFLKAFPAKLRKPEQ